MWKKVRKAVPSSSPKVTVPHVSVPKVTVPHVSGPKVTVPHIPALKPPTLSGTKLAKRVRKRTRIWGRVVTVPHIPRPVIIPEVPAPKAVIPEVPAPNVVIPEVPAPKVVIPEVPAPKPPMLNDVTKPAKKARKKASKVVEGTTKKVSKDAKKLEKIAIISANDANDTVKTGLKSGATLFPKIDINKVLKITPKQQKSISKFIETQSNILSENNLASSFAKLSTQLQPSDFPIVVESFTSMSKKFKFENIENFEGIYKQLGADATKAWKEAGLKLGASWNNLSPEHKRILIVIAVAAAIYFGGPVVIEALNASGVAVEFGFVGELSFGSTEFIALWSSKGGVALLGGLVAGTTAKVGEDKKSDADISMEINPPSKKPKPATSKPRKPIGGDPVLNNEALKKKKTKITSPGDELKVKLDQYQEKLTQLDKELKDFEKQMADAIDDKLKFSTISYGVDLVCNLPHVLFAVCSFAKAALESENIGQDETLKGNIMIVAQELLQMVKDHPDLLGNEAGYPHLKNLSKWDSDENIKIAVLGDIASVAYKASDAVIKVKKETKFLFDQLSTKTEFLYGIYGVTENQQRAKREKETLETKIKYLNEDYNQIITILNKATETEKKIEKKNTADSSERSSAPRPGR